MRALLQERKYQGQSDDGNNRSGKNTLYFGCKKRDVDYLYKDEIEEYKESKVLSSLHLAFSREQTEKVNKYIRYQMQFMCCSVNDIQYYSIPLCNLQYTCCEKAYQLQLMSCA